MGSDDVGYFKVDIDDLVDLVRDLGAAERRLETMTDAIERQVRALHEHWEGLAATAQMEAQQEWEKGLASMRAALAEMRAAVDVARENYDGAVQDNVAMWEQL